MVFVSLFLAALWGSSLIGAAESDRRRVANPTYYNVGGVLSSNESIAFFKDTISVHVPRYFLTFHNKFLIKILILFIS